MKIILKTLFIFILFQGVAQNTLIPDANFEQRLIDAGIDDFIDGSVLTNNIINVDTLNLSSANISDLTGLEGFISLTHIYCYNNPLTNIDLSGNTQLVYADLSENQLININISQNTLLETLDCSVNQLASIDLSQNVNLLHFGCQNNSITALDVSSNISLQSINCNGNLYTSLDFSNNPDLIAVACGYNSNLDCLNIKNGNNINILAFFSNYTPSLSCIEVDDPSYSSTNWTNIDLVSSFSINCSNNCSLALEPVDDKASQRKLLRIFDMVGCETVKKPNALLIYIYDDGTMEKVFIVE